MYNINVDLATSAATAANSLLVDSTTNTPRTPEILNSVIAMTNPLDHLVFEDSKKNISGVSLMSSDSNSSSCSQLESPTTNPPSIQHTCSQLIKAGLKLTIEQKRKQQSDGEDYLDLDNVKRMKRNDFSESEEDKIKLEPGLTPEDEERRRRRRERNKIAATKCRLKKRERTANLIQESEILETQNIDLKNQLHVLQKEQLTLTEILSQHRSLCQRNIGPITRDHLYKLPPVASVMETHSYNRPPSVDPNHRSNYLDAFSSRNGMAASSKMSSSRSPYSNNPPSIIIEEINDNYDFGSFSGIESFNYSSPCHNYATYSNSGIDSGCTA